MNSTVIRVGIRWAASYIGREVAKYTARRIHNYLKEKEKEKNDQGNKRLQ